MIEAHGLTGAADLLLRIVAVDAEDLFRVNKAILAVPGVERSDTTLAMGELIPYRVAPLLERGTCRLSAGLPDKGPGAGRAALYATETVAARSPAPSRARKPARHRPTCPSTALTLHPAAAAASSPSLSHPRSSPLHPVGEITSLSADLRTSCRAVNVPFRQPEQRYLPTGCWPDSQTALSPHRMLPAAGIRTADQAALP